MKTKMMVVAALCLFVLLMPMVSASETTESFTVYTDKSEYFVDERINIYVMAEAIDPNQTITVTDVVLYDPNNSSIAEWHGISIEMNTVGTQHYVGTATAAAEGEYTVYANATGCPWILRAIWRFIIRWFRPRNVVPEVPIGTIMVSVMMIIGFAAYATVPHWRKKAQITAP